jgi:hypothetical protein
MNPVVDIFLRTYSKDHEYLHYALRSITKFCTGFRQVVIVSKEDATPAIGYASQQISKHCADQFTDADFILFTDSDALFKTPVTPETYLRDGKPVWLKTPFRDLEGSDCHKAWFSVVAEFFGQEPEYETMRRHPFMVPRWLLKEIRDWCEFQHGKTIEQYVFDKGRHSEFNIMGTFAWLHHRDRFHWIDTSKDELPPETIHQMWSHTPFHENKAIIKQLLQ